MKKFKRVKIKDFITIYIGYFYFKETPGIIKNSHISRGL